MSSCSTPTSTGSDYSRTKNGVSLSGTPVGIPERTPPKIFSTLPPLLLKQQHPASIPIKVTGFPSPLVRWFVGGKRAEDSQGYRVSTGPGRKSRPEEILTVLEIANVNQNLEGGIKVVAENDLGLDEFIVPLKTYRLLSGRYLEEPDGCSTASSSSSYGRNLKTEDVDRCRTIDKRLFRNEVEEACKRIRIYQAYGNISKSHENFTVRTGSARRARGSGGSGSSGDPVMEKWKREMAARNAMKSIDDIIDNFDLDNNDDDSENSRPKPKSIDHLKRSHRGNGGYNPTNASFRSDVGPYDRNKPQQIYERSISFSTKRDTDRAFPTKADAAQSPRSVQKRSEEPGEESVFMFSGTKLSEFCEKVLKEKIPDHQLPRKYSFQKELDLWTENRQSSRPQLSSPGQCDHSVSISTCDHFRSRNNGGVVAVPIAEPCEESNLVVSSYQIASSRLLTSQAETRLTEELKESKKVSRLDVTDHLAGKENRELYGSHRPRTEEAEAIQEQKLKADKISKTETSESSQRNNLGLILTDLNQQLECLGSNEKLNERDRCSRVNASDDVAIDIRSPELRTKVPDNSTRLRSVQSRSEVVEKESSSLADFSEFSRSLSALTQKLEVELDDIKVTDGVSTVVDTLLLLPQQLLKDTQPTHIPGTNSEFTEATVEAGAKVEDDRCLPVVVPRIGVVKPQVAKKPTLAKKPALLPKPQLKKGDAVWKAITGGNTRCEKLKSGQKDELDDPDRSSESSFEILHPSSSSSLASPSYSSSLESSTRSRSFTPSPSSSAASSLTSLSSPLSMLSPPASAHVTSSSSSSPPEDYSFTTSNSPASMSSSSSSPLTSTMTPRIKTSLIGRPGFRLPLPPPPPLPEFTLLRPSLTPMPIHLSSSSLSSSSSLPSSSSSSTSCPASAEMGRRRLSSGREPTKDSKSFRVYELVRKRSLSPSQHRHGSFQSGSGGRSFKRKSSDSESSIVRPTKSSTGSARSVEFLSISGTDSPSSGISCSTPNTVRRALSQKYELVTVTTREEVITLKKNKSSCQQMKKTGEGRAAHSGSLNAAEKLYYLLEMPVSCQEEPGYDNDDVDCSENEWDSNTDGPRNGGSRAKVAKEEVDGKHTADQRSGREAGKDSEKNYDTLVDSLLTLARNE